MITDSLFTLVKAGNWTVLIFANLLEFQLSIFMFCV